MKNGKVHGKHIGIAKRCSEGIQTGGNAVTEKRIAEPVAGRDRIFRWKGLLNGNAGDDTEMEIDISIGTLAGMQTISFTEKRMGREHIGKENKSNATKDQKYPVLFQEREELITGRQMIRCTF